jgi:multiple sugar transport system substrate-binding protein
MKQECNPPQQRKYPTFNQRFSGFGASLVLLVLVLASCSRERGTSDNQITYWSSNNGGEIAFSNWAVDAWQRQQPAGKIKYQPVPEGQSSEEIILAAVVAGTTPDIYSNIWQGTVAFYSDAHILVALDTLEGFLDFLQSRCSAATIREITADDGHIYQLPWKINPIMTIYNERLIKELGYDTFPASYPEYLTAAQNFQRDDNGDGYVDQWFGNTSVNLAWYQRLFNFYPLYLAASNGEPLVKDGRANFNNKYAVEAFRFLQTLYRKNYFSKQSASAAQDLFIAEQYASKWTGPWEIQYLERFKKADFHYSFAPVPVPAGHQGAVYTYCDPKSFVIFNTCRHPQQAWEFIKTMVTEEGDLQFLKMTNQLPRRQHLDTIAAFQAYFEAFPKLQAFANQAKYVVGVDNNPYLTEIFDIISQEYEACVLYQTKTPEQAIADAEAAVNVLLRAEQS